MTVTPRGQWRKHLININNNIIQIIATAVRVVRVPLWLLSARGVLETLYYRGRLKNTIIIIIIINDKIILLNRLPQHTLSDVLLQYPNALLLLLSCWPLWQITTERHNLNTKVKPTKTPKYTKIYWYFVKSTILANYIFVWVNHNMNFIKPFLKKFFNRCSTMAIDERHFIGVNLGSPCNVVSRSKLDKFRYMMKTMFKNWM